MKTDLRKLIRINGDYLIKVMSPPKLSSINISNLDEALKVKVIDTRKNMDLGVYTLGAAKIKFFGDDIPLVNIPKLKKTGKLQLTVPQKDKTKQSKPISAKV